MKKGICVYPVTMTKKNIYYTLLIFIVIVLSASSLLKWLHEREQERLYQQLESECKEYIRISIDHFSAYLDDHNEDYYNAGITSLRYYSDIYSQYVIEFNITEPPFFDERSTFETMLSYLDKYELSDYYISMLISVLQDVSSRPLILFGADFGHFNNRVFEDILRKRVVERSVFVENPALQNS